MCEINRRTIALALAAFLVTGLTGCGQGSEDTIGNISGGDTVGILLEGNPDALTLDAVRDYDSGDRTTPDEISVDPDGMEIDRTNVQIALAETTTVGEINALLESIGGRIVNMIEGVNVIIVKIPDPGDLDALDAVIADIEASPLVDWVLEADMSGEDTLPGNYDPATTDLTKIDHHIAVLAPAAWNARAALDFPAFGAPLLLQSDYFGNGQPDADFDINALDPTDFATGNPNQHGYHVLGIITGLHTADATKTTNRDLVTGMYPGKLGINASKLEVRVVDRREFNRPTSENEIAKVIRLSGRRVVLNTSLHSGCARPPQAACVRPRALAWLRALRGDIAYFGGQTSVWENSFLLHMTSAGNFKTQDAAGNPVVDTRTASLNSQYAAAKLMVGLTVTEPGSAFGTAVPNVANTLVVENRVNSAAPYAPGCLAASSKFPGDISAIGAQVWSFTDFAATSKNKTGTSMSTPQVAGLGAYIWALKPTLTPQEVINIIQSTARTYPGDAVCTDVPKPVIDAYAATLAVDDKKAIDPATANPMTIPNDAPARLAILDVVGDAGSAGTNRAFDEDDLSKFVDAFEAAGGAARDFSRYDLNGDGFTGGTDKHARFNLDMDAAQAYGSVMQDIDGTMVTYNENLVTDWEVLCYNAFSPLYTGTLGGRTAALDEHLPKCGVLVAEIIVFESNRDGNRQIYAVNTDGSNLRNLTNSMGSDTSPVLSPDASKIAFITTRSGIHEIYVMDANGSNQTKLANAQAGDIRLVWSPNGMKIAYEHHIGNWEIFVMDADGSNQTNLTNDPEDDQWPTWSPDSSQIAFQSFRDGDFEIYVMDADGNNQVNITNDPLWDRLPAWSPSGSTIAFQRGMFVTLEIYTVNTGGGAASQLTDNDDSDGRPVWSPDGTLILFNSFRDKDSEIYVMAAGGGNQINLTDSANLDWRPAWSPDGMHIVFESLRDGNSEIYMMDANGDNQVNISNSPADDIRSDWR